VPQLRSANSVHVAVGLFQVQAAGLRTDFPPLRALDASPGSLRAATTSFIGRESEVAEVQAAVMAAGHGQFLWPQNRAN
jgi:hypothetical protein